MPPRVSLVMIVRDEAAVLPRCLGSVVDLVGEVVVVDTGSTDLTAKLLAEAAEPGGVAAGPDSQPVLSGVITRSSEIGFAAAIAAAVAHAVQRWGDPGAWLWLLHDDCEPAPDALEQLLRGAAETPNAAVLGPKVRDWSDRDVILEAGVTIDTVGRRITGIEPR